MAGMGVSRIFFVPSIFSDGPFLLALHFYLCHFVYRFKDIFQEVYEAGWKSKYEAAGIWYNSNLHLSFNMV